MHLVLDAIISQMILSPQMDEPEGKTTSKDEVVTERSTGEDGKGMKKKKRKIPEEVKDVDDRYKGYELLLDIDESALDPDIPIPKGQCQPPYQTSPSPKLIVSLNTRYPHLKAHCQSPYQISASHCSLFVSVPHIPIGHC